MTRKAPLPEGAVEFFRSRFRAQGSPARAVGERAYLKSSLNFHGVSMPEIRGACADFCKSHPGLDRDALRALAAALYATDWHDLRSAAIGVLERRNSRLEGSDLPWLVDLVRSSANWAHVDWLATKVIGAVVEREADAERRRVLRQWARDGDFWVRRTALLAQLGALRTGKGDFDLFTEIASPMLDEKEFFIRKAIGWVLREVSKRRPELVASFLRDHGHRASKLTLREATKYMPA